MDLCGLSLQLVYLRNLSFFFQNRGKSFLFSCGVTANKIFYISSLLHCRFVSGENKSEAVTDTGGESTGHKYSVRK